MSIKQNMRKTNFWKFSSD